jgi:GT2 family glycosyltransferase
MESVRAGHEVVAGPPDLRDTSSVVVCAYHSRRWRLLQESLRAVLAQTRPPGEVVLVVDHNKALQARAEITFPELRVVANEGERGLSAARNTGVRHSSGEIVVFLDDDACPDEDWLEQLLGAYDDPSVIGTGGLALPRWAGERPAWLPEEFGWVVGCSYRGLPDDVAPIRNPIGANMSFRRSALLLAGEFVDGIGRVGALPLGCEETELSIRARAAHPGGLILHVPAARVHHLVPGERARWSYFRRRCWAEGLSKARVARRTGPQAALASERAYVARTLPRGVLRGLGDALRGDLGGIGRAAAIVIGLAFTSAGYARGRLAG